MCLKVFEKGAGAFSQTPPKTSPSTTRKCGLPEPQVGVFDTICLMEQTAPLDWNKDRCFSFLMGQMLTKLLDTSPAYDIRRDKDGFVLTPNPGHTDEFSDLVREASRKAGDDFVVFTTSDGHHGYSQMFVMPLDDIPLAK